MASLSFRASIDTASKPVIQALIAKPLREMATVDRKALASGPTIALMVGETRIANNIPKRAAMGMSEVLNNALTKYPHSSTLMLNPEEVNEGTVATLIDFIVGSSHVSKPFNLRKPTILSDCIELYRHALMFGLGRYAGHLRKAIIDEINTDVITPYSALDELMKLPATDRCYVAVVHKFEGLSYIGELEGDKDWEAWLAAHSDFVAAMGAWKVKRKARAAENRATRRAIKWEQDFPALV